MAGNIRQSLAPTIDVGAFLRVLVMTLISGVK
jgi:hypothetical protein